MLKLRLITDKRYVFYVPANAVVLYTENFDADCTFGLFINCIKRNINILAVNEKSWQIYQGKIDDPQAIFDLLSKLGEIEKIKNYYIEVWLKVPKRKVIIVK